VIDVGDHVRRYAASMYLGAVSTDRARFGARNELPEVPTMHALGDDLATYRSCLYATQLR
jgi:hypothetical protein